MVAGKPEALVHDFLGLEYETLYRYSKMVLGTYFVLEYGDDGDEDLWFLLGCECRFAFVSRPPPGDILPASAFRECSMTGGGRLPSGLVTMMPRHRLRLRYQPPPYLLISAVARPPPASSPTPTNT
ncbi:jg5332 [Pararge aegeria aegeria]|uniref:Jg5332 protein n=1 Tax=Pararge aegeria aegeria TaxID=348720 RepID=A0A8S4R7M7_9NEOP|nr:jg5332 [Pararge aegeria aegeria]